MLFRAIASILLFSILLGGCSKEGLGSRKLEPSENLRDALESVDGPDVPTIENALLKSAKQAEAAGNYKNAAQFYGQVLEKQADNAEYLYAYAEALRKTGGYPAALVAYEKLQDHKKYEAAALEGMGLSLMAQGQFDKAGDRFAEVMEKDAARWRTLNGIGILFTIKGMYPEARQYFAEAQALSPRNVSINNNLALMEAMDKHYDEAIRLLEEAVKFSGVTPQEQMQLDMNQALIFAIEGRLDKARTVAGKHLTEAQLYNNMGYYAYLAEDEQLAKSYLNMALTKSQNHYEKAWKNLETLNNLLRHAPNQQ